VAVAAGKAASALNESRTTGGVDAWMGREGNQKRQQAGTGAGAVLSCRPNWRCGSEWRDTSHTLQENSRTPS